MKIYKNGIILLTLMSFSMFYSCSKNEDAQDKNKPNVEQNSASTGKSSVFPVIKVDAPIGKQAANFSWKEDNQAVNFAEFTKGKFVFLNFWGTWCPPCRREIPDIVQLAAEMKNKNLVVIGVALERVNTVEEAIDVVSRFSSSNNMGYTNVIATQQLTEAFGGIESVPTTFLIDDKGMIAQVIQGSQSKEAFMTEINKMMKK
ncbi:MAG: alkyl hydroperoxide reductase/Thiol specific antioxidant/Mal allergen [Ignavibacteria bacterium]|nr:alkyl hydroperoxide reductase/Thiol specific antioxidant/Mal allergen [Ignavibacteria bacterium]